MKKVLASVALAWVGAAVLLAQSSASRPSAPDPSRAQTQTAAPAAAPAATLPRAQAAPAQVVSAQASTAPTAAETAKHQAWITKYCVGCHNTRTPQPATEPVNLEVAKLADLPANAVTWERVLRKLGHRAMPPQGMPHPAEAEYAAFTAYLSSSLDRSWRGKTTPGTYVMHRLNRTEYGNAIRDLLALDVDITELLPSDGANYGFDNIAASLRTSPLLL
ncbi:MAG TPA: DUF1587 domain-containing protein, partial [Vicinamibacterales bacterium]